MKQGFAIGNTDFGITTTAMASAASIKISAGTLSALRSDVTFSNANGVSFGLDGAGNVTASVAAGGGALTNIKVSAGTLSALRSDITFSNGSGVSFGLDAGGNITATVKTDYQSSGAYLTTAMQSNAATISNIKVSAGTLSANRSDITFSNSNGVGFGLETNGVITASYTVPTVTNSSWTVSDAVTSATVGRLAFTNSNGLTLSLSTSNNGNHTVIGSYTVPTVTNSSWTVSDAVTSATVGRLAFTNSNGLTLSLSTSNNGNHTVIGSYTVPTVTNSSWTVSNSATSATVGRLAFSDGNGVTFSLSTSNNGNQTIFGSVQTNYLTTAALSSQTLAFTLGGNSATTNSSQILNGGYVLAGGANITIQQSNNSISISGAAAGTGAAGVAVSNSQTLFSTGTVAFSEGGGAITIATSAGGQSFKFSVPQTSSLVGANGISISTNGSTISVYDAPTLSYFENIPMLDAASTTLSASGSVLQVVPFILPNAMSVGWIRLPVSMSYVSTEVSGTTANSTWTVNRSYTDAAVILKQNTGASSLSLVYVTSSSATWVFQNQIQAGANGSRYTVTQNVSYPISGTTSNYTTSYPQSSANVQISSASMTLFTGARWLDIPFAVSLSAGNYWLALGRSTNSATQAGNVNLGGASMGMSLIGISQNNLSFAFPGGATNSSIPLQPGLGSWSTNAAVMSSSSLQLASISAASSGPKPYFQMMRFA